MDGGEGDDGGGEDEFVGFDLFFLWNISSKMYHCLSLEWETF